MHKFRIVIRIILMIGLTQYLQYAKAQNRDLNKVEGIIIYEKTGDTFPPVVILIPTSKPDWPNFATYLKTTFESPPVNAYLIYMSPIKWILSDLKERIDSLSFFEILYGGEKKKFRVSYGCFTMDKTFPLDQSIPEDLTITNVPVVFKNENYVLDVSDLPEIFGVPKLFERGDFEFIDL